MSELEKAQQKTIVDKIRDIEEAGLLHVKGYKNSEIAGLLGISVADVKKNIEEYKNVIRQQAEDDPYFLERVQYNTIKALTEFDELSKEAWETISIATDHGMVSARIQAIKLAGELAKGKAQLHKLMGNQTSDSDYIARMQKAESVNNILSRVLRDVIAKYPEIADAVRKELAIAFEIDEEEAPIDADIVDLTSEENEDFPK